MPRLKEGAKKRIENAELSPGYRNFRKMFLCKCKACGNTHCLTGVTLSRKGIAKSRLHFTCLNCGALWQHMLTFEDTYEEMGLSKPWWKMW